MKTRVFVLVYCFLLPAGLGVLLWARVGAYGDTPRHTQPGDKIESALLAEMATADQPLRFIIQFSQKADLSILPANVSVEENRAALVELLQETAVTTQAPLLPQLDSLQQSGELQSYRPLWIINAIAAVGTAEAIQALAAQPDVAAIRQDAVVDRVLPPDENSLLNLLQSVTPAGGPTRPWGIDQVRAAHVWYGLGVEGEGAVVGIMDTGVDFQHPILAGNYRGNLGGGQYDHAGNWFDAVYPTRTMPVDSFGHGTHVAGTAVGAYGIGVAPGARWMAANIANEFGFIYSSDAHAAFEWFLAPNDDPSLAPDVINASWSGPGYNTEFWEDVNALHTAGIIPVFAAGNAGPFTQTIGAPASYADTLAIGASDDIDAVAWFSSLGPSPLTDEIKPWVVAPGTQTLSALPDNRYGYYNGTSMATPHTVGTIALLLSANPALTRPQLRQILAETAVPLSTTHPNMTSGWGRLDAYSAVQTQVTTGRLAGTISANGNPLPAVPITITSPSGAMAFQSDENGMYEAFLQPGSYSVAVSYFGFVNYLAGGLIIQPDQTRSHNIALTPLPSGVVEGFVRDANTQSPLPGVRVRVEDTPLESLTDGNGRYSLSLPAGSYQLIAQTDHYRLGKATIQPVIGGTVIQNFSLLPGPQTLLIDSGQWYFQPQAAYYQESLTALGYAHDTWTIRHPLNDAPRVGDFANYDYVVWAAPKDSPGILGANNVITNYLGHGGNLFISGQNVAAYDGYGFGTQLWWYRDLGANFMGETAVTHTIQGADGSIFDGLSLTLNGGDSANNQSYPDVSAPSRFRLLTDEMLVYEDGRAAGLRSGHCRPGRIVYLGFGLEGVTDAADRQTLLAQSFDYFASPLIPYGVHFTHEPVDDFAIPGTNMVYTLTLQNLSETLTDTFTLRDVSAGWPTSLVTTTLTLGPCEIGHTVLHLQVPVHAAKDTRHTTRVTAVSTNNPATSNLSLLQHKTPGQLLFVDDDRWYDEETHLTNALDANGLEYDVWETGWRDGFRRNSPSAALLHEYDFVIWYTGYDWFAPVLSEEVQSLTEYLAGGGRLFLTSQDFLYYNHDTTLARDYLGILAYRESVTPTQAFGGSHPGVGVDLAGPLALTRGRYQNNGDGVIPTSNGQPFFWHNSGMPAGVSVAGQTWRSIFWGIPFETLPDEQETATMNRIMGWLGDLGDSTFEVDTRVGMAVATRTYTITLRNTAVAPTNQVRMINQLPPELTIVPGSVQGATYYPAAHVLIWQGALARGKSRQIVYQAVPDAALLPGTAVTNSLTIHYDRHDLSFDRTTVFWVDAPDLAASTFTAVPNPAQATTQIAYLLTVRNTGLTAANNITANMRLPDELTVLSATLLATSGHTWAEGQRILWQGQLAPGQSAMIRVIALREEVMGERWLAATAVIQDGITNTILKEQILHLSPYKLYFPLTIQK
jgi:uncharacterized repeat protein (TIGR01451 family)